MPRVGPPSSAPQPPCTAPLYLLDSSSSSLTKNTSFLSGGSTMSLFYRDLGARGSARTTSKMDKVGQGRGRRVRLEATRPTFFGLCLGFTGLFSLSAFGNTFTYGLKSLAVHVSKERGPNITDHYSQILIKISFRKNVSQTSRCSARKAHKAAAPRRGSRT